MSKGSRRVEVCVLTSPPCHCCCPCKSRRLRNHRRSDWESGLSSTWLDHSTHSNTSGCFSSQTEELQMGSDLFFSFLYAAYNLVISQEVTNVLFFHSMVSSPPSEEKSDFKSTKSRKYWLSTFDFWTLWKHRCRSVNISPQEGTFHFPPLICTITVIVHIAHYCRYHCSESKYVIICSFCLL